MNRVNVAFHHRHTCPQNSSHFTAVKSSTEQQSVSGSLHITLSGWRSHFKRSLSHSPVHRRYHRIASKVKIPTQITESAMELILVALERVMFAAVVAVVVMSVLSTRQNKKSLPPRSRLRVAILSAQNVATNIRKPTVSCKCTIPSLQPFKAIANLYIFIFSSVKSYYFSTQH